MEEPKRTPKRSNALAAFLGVVLALIATLPFVGNRLAMAGSILFLGSVLYGRFLLIDRLMERRVSRPVGLLLWIATALVALFGTLVIQMALDGL